MKRIKNPIKVLLVVAALMMVSPSVKAQIPVTDAGHIGETIRQGIMEQAQFLEQIKQGASQLLEAQDIGDVMRGAYRTISPMLKNSSELRNLYTNYLLIQDDIERVKFFISTVESGTVSPTRIARLYSLSDRVLKDAYEEIKYITDIVLNPAELLNSADRLEKIEELNESLMSNGTLIDDMLEDIKVAKAKRAAAAAEKNYVNNAFNKINVDGNAPTITPSINLSDIPSLSDPRKIGAETDVTGSYNLDNATKKFTDKVTIDRIFNIASLLIGIIAVGYSAWNFAMKNSGDRQRQDSQFKVFAGMLIGILLLQALKAMFF